MPLRHDHAVGPPQERECRELRLGAERFGGHADVGLAFQQHGGDLARIALRQDQANLGKLRAELRHHGGKHIARLGVGGGDPQFALVTLAELLANALDVAGVDQHALDDADQLLARLREAQEPLSLAFEQRDAEFDLQVLDVLGHARLRGVERVGHLGQVEVVLDGLAKNTELLEIHGFTACNWGAWDGTA